MHIYGINYFYQTDYDSISKIALPDGCTDLVFACNENKPYAEFHGTVITPETAMEEDNTVYFGVSFETGFNYIFSQLIDVNALIQGSLPADCFFENSNYKKIFEAKDFIDRIRYFLTCYLPIYEKACVIDYKKTILEHVVDEILKTKGSITEKELSIETGYSERYLNRLFHEKIGVNPKLYSKMIRFQSALTNINQNYSLTLTEQALRLGYYDQAHFIRDFKSFSGMTPKKYSKMIRSEEFDKKIKLLKKIQEF